MTRAVHLVVGALLVRGDTVLLAHRSPLKRWYPDVWDLVGGHVDDGEAPERALQRELAEELGVQVDDDELGNPVAHVVDPSGEDGGLDIRIWAVDSWDGDVVNRTDEHDELRWVSRHDVASLPLAHPALGPLVLQVLGDR